MDQMGIPCSHYIATLNHLGKSEEVYKAFDNCYKVANYYPTSTSIELVLDEDIQLDESVLAPKATTTVGHLHMERFASQGEDISRSQRNKRVCGLCGEEGHKKRTCGK